ncbi:hypothetical protein [Bdellovibrio sp. HCB274]|uniref:hypothetical protein n=1 Tax=Bdellovibrio sp. HCB274 TaxID=3394361 RepID=UPI0039B61ECA
MNWVSKALILISALLLSNNSAEARQNCGRFLCGSSYSQLDSLSEETEKLVKSLKSEGPAAPKDLASEIRRIETQNENYFKSAGIAYARIPTPLKVKSQSFTYSRYSLRGSAQGDATSKSLAETSVPVILDPLYLYNYKYFGHFLNEKIFVGPHVFRLNLLGITSTLQHEQLHSVEHEKVREGKMSLGRLELMNSEGRRSVNYGNYFRVDEIETHLHDYQLLTDSALNAQRDLDLIAQGLSSEALDQIKKYREVIVKDKIQNLQRFSSESLEMLGKIRTRILHGAIPYSSKYDPQTGAIRVIFTTEYKSYEYMSFDLQGMAIPADLTDWVKIRELVLQVIDWSQQRVQSSQIPALGKTIDSHPALQTVYFAMDSGFRGPNLVVNGWNLEENTVNQMVKTFGNYLQNRSVVRV